MTPVEPGITRSIGVFRALATARHWPAPLHPGPRGALALPALTRNALTSPAGFKMGLRQAHRRGLNQIRREHPTAAAGTSETIIARSSLCPCGFLRRSKRNGSPRQSTDFISPRTSVRSMCGHQ